MKLFFSFCQQFITIKLLLFLVTLCLILVTSCQPNGVCISSINTQASRLTFRVAAGVECDKPASNVAEVYVTLDDITTKFAPVLWTIKSQSLQGARLDTLVYGIIPEGFTQTTPALPIRPGDKITANVIDRNDLRHSVEVTLKK